MYGGSSLIRDVIANRHQPENGPLLATYGLVLGLLAVCGVGLFWAMGAVLLLSGNGGQINDLRLTGLWRTLYFAYPIVALAGIGAALLAFKVGRYLEAGALVLLGPAAAVLYYLALVTLR